MTTTQKALEHAEKMAADARARGAFSTALRWDRKAASLLQKLWREQRAAANLRETMESA